ncbi:544_t:CDS:2, partial [Gigaspora rosea]
MPGEIVDVFSRSNNAEQKALAQLVDKGLVQQQIVLSRSSATVGLICRV